MTMSSRTYIRLHARYTMSSMASTTILLIVVGGAGCAGGVLLGRWWGKKAHQNILIADPGEAAEARAEAMTEIAKRTERRLDRIVAQAAERGQIANDDVEDMFCISDRTASAYLARLVRLRRLERVGAGRGTYYVPVGGGVRPQPEAAGDEMDAVSETAGAAEPRPRKTVRKKVSPDTTAPQATGQGKKVVKTTKKRVVKKPQNKPAT